MEKKNSITREEVVRKVVGYYEFNKKNNRNLDYFDAELRTVSFLFDEDIIGEIFAEIEKRGI